MVEALSTRSDVFIFAIALPLGVYRVIQGNLACSRNASLKGAYQQEHGVQLL